MEPEPRDELRALSPAIHGGDAPAGVLDFSTGVSPLPTPPAILEAARAADLSRYPHPTAAPLAIRIAAAHGVPVDEVVAGAGSAELIWALARAFGGPGRHALLFAPAFAEYAQAMLASGGRVQELRAEPRSFAFAPEAARRALANQPSLVFVCRPSNPCLSSLPLPLLDELAARAPSTLFVVDEAYLPLYEELAPATPRPNVVRLRSLTKLFALPGLRVGYLLGPASIARAVQSALPPWNVSAPAIAAGMVAVEALSIAPSIAREISALRNALAETLASPATPLDAAGGPFLLLRVGDATSFTRRLLDEGVRVRDASSFGLPAHVRVGVRPLPEQAELARAWRKLAR